MASFKPLYLPHEKPLFRDYYRSVFHSTTDSARGINGPIFSRLYCGGSNANGAAFRLWGTADLEAPTARGGGGLARIDRPYTDEMGLRLAQQQAAAGSMTSRRMMASYSSLQQPREKHASEWHIHRTRGQHDVELHSRGSEADYMSIKWPPRTLWTRHADGTSLYALR